MIKTVLTIIFQFYNGNNFAHFDFYVHPLILAQIMSLILIFTSNNLKVKKCNKYQAENGINLKQKKTVSS